MILDPENQALFDGLLEQLEPLAFLVPNLVDESGSHDPALWSMAISLKRIADATEKMPAEIYAAIANGLASR